MKRQGARWAYFRDTIRAHRAKWVSSFVVTQILPFVEIGMIGLVYILLKPDKAEIAHSVVRHLPAEFAPYVTTDGIAYLVFAAALMLLAAQLLLYYFNQMTLTRLRIDVYVDDSRALLTRYFAAPLTTVRKIGRDHITSSIINDCGVLGDIVKQWLEICGALLALTVYLASAATLSWQMLVIAASVYALPLYLNRNAFGKLRLIGRMKVTAQEQVLRYFNDILSGFGRVKLDALEAVLQERSSAIVQASQNWRLARRTTQARLRVAVDGISLFGVLIVIFVGATVLHISLATLLVLFVMFGRMRTHVGTVTTTYSNIRLQEPNAERFLDLMVSLHRPVANGTDRRTPISRITLEGVTFAYGDGEMVLRGVDLDIVSGDRVLITGPSGHGKSTFLEILAGLLPPDTGEVRYNGEPLDTALFRRVRQNVAFVAPNLYLFDDTLRANLTIGADPNQVDQRLPVAIGRAGLTDVVAGLANGLDTRIGPDGAELSLGQRQRVVLARLYMKDPDLVLLDEATANLDPTLEADLIARMQEFLRPEAIVVMVAHKPPHNYACTGHYRFEDGRLHRVENLHTAVAE